MGEIKHGVIELITDPDSKQLSMSRLCLGVLVIDILALSILDVCGIKFGAWGHLAVIVGSVTGCYAVNSGARVWRNYIPGRVRPPED